MFSESGFFWDYILGQIYPENDQADIDFFVNLLH